MEVSKAKKVIIMYSTVLENFSRKSRNTVSVREGQAVVLLCGPPLHYGGMLFYSDSSALPAVVTSLLVSAICIVPHTAACSPSALSPLFFCLYTSFCCASSGTHFHHISPTVPPYRSENKLFLNFFAHPAHAVTSTLILLNLEFTFLACLICVHALIYKVSSARLPQVTFSPQCGQVIFG